MKYILMSFFALLSTFSVVLGAPVGALATSHDLFMAVKTNNDKALRSMLKFHHDLEVKNEAGNTLLVEAVLMGNRSAVKRILSYGVSVNAFDMNHKTALDIAVEYGYAKIALDLVKHGAKVTNQDNLYYLKSMLKDRSFSLLVQFSILWIFGQLFRHLLDVCFSPIFVFVAIFGGFLVAVGYIGYTISLPFRAYSWHSAAQCSWLIHGV